jgi:predicted nucleotidyltransferase component of viral defense system
MLYTTTVEPNTLGLLIELMQKPYLQGFNLVGGTALSMQIGHRISIDLDMFTTEPFDTLEIKSKLEDDYPVFQVLLESQNTIITNINNIKVDFILFKYGFTYPIITEKEIRLVNIKDIAPMKLDAITGRGKKKDFYDLYFLLKKFSLPEILEMYQHKYQHTTIFHVIKSITYFHEADTEPDPIVIDKKVKWNTIKKKLTEEVNKL